MQTHPCSAHIVMTPEEESLLKAIVNLSPYKRSELVRKCFFEGYKNKSGSIYAEDLLRLSIIKNEIAESKNVFEKDMWLMASRKRKVVNVSEEILAAFNEKYRDLEAARSKVKMYAVQFLLEEQMLFVDAVRAGKQTRQAAISLTKNEKTLLKDQSRDRGETISKLLLDSVFSGCVSRRIVVDSFLLNTESAREYSGAINRISSESSAAKNYAFVIKSLTEMLRWITSLDFSCDANTAKKEAKKIVQNCF